MFNSSHEEVLHGVTIHVWQGGVITNLRPPAMQEEQSERRRLSSQDVATKRLISLKWIHPMPMPGPSWTLFWDPDRWFLDTRCQETSIHCGVLVDSLPSSSIFTATLGCDVSEVAPVQREMLPNLGFSSHSTIFACIVCPGIERSSSGLQHCRRG